MKKSLFLGCLVTGVLLFGAGCGTEKATERSDEEVIAEEMATQTAIQQALATYFNHATTETRMILTDKEDTYARGTVRFTDNLKDTRLVLLKKETDWKVAYDGSGEMICESQELVGFPEQMIKDCIPAGITFGDLQEIQEAVAKKTTVSIERLVLRINQHTPEHAMGAVVIQGQEDELNVYAVKGESGWEIVYLGTGAIACKTGLEKGFSDRLIPHCVAEE